MSGKEQNFSHAQKEYAGFGARFGASILDGVLVALIMFPLLDAIYGDAFWESEALVLGMPDFLISYVFPPVATILFWVYKAATPGKMALKVKVVDANTGNPPSTQQSIIRYVGYYISALPICLGYLWMLWDPKKQTWHDKMAGTLVVRAEDKDAEEVTFSG